MSEERTISGEIVSCVSCGRRNRLPPSAKGTPRCSVCHQPLPWLVETDDSDFSAVAEESRLPVVVEFWAPWCGPCRMVAPALERLAREFAGRLKVVKVNVDESPRLADRFGVRGIPLLLLMQQRREIDRLVGAQPADKLIHWVKGWLEGRARPEGR
ncbi:MAG TPA: thioredoxin [Acidimicrobiia bacterium]|nr:thioredoxin [Acidimicrobiia bacterium]